jgi:hypothetical protein
MRLLLILILTFSFNTLIKADDIRDFQIEGVSIGDSLLDYFNESEINKFSNYDELPSDMKFRISDIFPKNMKMNKYDGIQVFYKPNDKRFIIQSIGGRIKCKKKSEAQCKKIYNNISQDLIKIFTNIKMTKHNFKHFDDKSGKSIVNKSEFKMKGGEVFVNYTNWSRKMEKKYWDNVSVSISNNDTLKWMSNNYGAK